MTIKEIFKEKKHLKLIYKKIFMYKMLKFFKKKIQYTHSIFTYLFYRETEMNANFSFNYNDIL
jgi:hypothetical protein